MLHVLVGVGQVLYAYNLELKEGNVPNEFGTANLTCFFFFFSSFHLEFFQLCVTSISVTGGLQTGLDSKIPTVHVL